ncbi:MAG: alpha/beta hydrolase [Ignavibacteria bacterium]|nr:alpha/beta hydrolase [Ignavibacteria bacterium]
MKNLLLLHGALGSSQQMEPLKASLSGIYKVHTLNFSGHGGGEIPAEPFSMEMFAGDIIRYIDNNNIAGTDIFGYSMGGYAALYAALKNPGKIGKIFTLATKFEWTPETAEREVKMFDAEKIKQKVPKFAEELSLRHGQGIWINVLTKTAEMMMALGSNNMLTHELLGEVKNEVLVGIGDRDKMVTLEETIAAYRALPNASLTVLAETPHPIEQIDTEKLTNEIMRFFK